MPKINNLEIYLLLGISAFLILIIVIVGLAIFINDFSAELRYLNNEIARTEGAERSHYIRKRRRLWLSLIPFVKY